MRWKSSPPAPLLAKRGERRARLYAVVQTPAASGEGEGIEPIYRETKGMSRGEIAFPLPGNPDEGKGREERGAPRMVFLALGA